MFYWKRILRCTWHTQWEGREAMARKKAAGKVRKKATAKAARRKVATAKKGKRAIHGRMGRPKDI